MKELKKELFFFTIIYSNYSPKWLRLQIPNIFHSVWASRRPKSMSIIAWQQASLYRITTRELGRRRCFICLVCRYIQHRGQDKRLAWRHGEPSEYHYGGKNRAKSRTDFLFMRLVKSHGAIVTRSVSVGTIKNDDCLYRRCVTPRKRGSRE